MEGDTSIRRCEYTRDWILTTDGGIGGVRDPQEFLRILIDVKPFNFKCRDIFSGDL